MKDLFQKLLGKRWLVITVIILVLIIGGYFYFSGGKSEGPQVVTAKRGTIIQEVTVTGKTKPVEDVDLSFEKSGRVVRVNVDVGDKVFTGQSLIELDSSELYAQLRQDEAALSSQKAELGQLKRGTRQEEIDVKQAELQKAQQDLANDYTGVLNILQSAYASADDAVRSKAGALFTNGETANPQLILWISDPQIEADLKTLRLSSGDCLNKWKAELGNLNANSSNRELDQAMINAKAYLSIIRDFTTKGLDAMSKTINVSAATLDTYKTNLNAGRTNVNTAISNLSDEEQSILSQKALVQKIQNELNLDLAGSTPEDIAAQEAQVEQAEGKVQLTMAQIGKTVLRSPINGTVTKQDAKVGEIAALNAPLVSVISANHLEMEADIPEADIAKVKVGDSARVTLDAYGPDVIFEAKVIEIDPGETIIEGVATYQTTFEFLKDDDRVKPGMTANIDILTDKRENVIVVPQRAVTVRNSERYVLLDKGQGKIEEKEVKVGLRGSDGNIEILSGLEEGDTVQIPQLQQ